jgi:hypothetical protein
MKTHTKYFQVNPIGRDLIIMIFAGMLAAFGLVTAGLVLLNQL